MRLSIIFFVVLILACQSQKKNTGETENTPNTVQTQAKNIDQIGKIAEIEHPADPVASKSGRDTQQNNEQCYKDVCLQLRNHDASKKSFDIFMINTVPVFGFQCDLPGINITGSDGGLLQENEYQTSNSAFRILSFSMQARSLPAGGGVLTTIYYSEPAKEVCMTAIIFAGIGGSKLENDIPECLQLN